MLSGKVALVTGGSRGIGKAIALKLAQEGADVAVLYAGNAAAAQATVDEITALGRKAAAWKCDVADFDASKETVAAVMKEFGGVDILVNNAGITRDTLLLTMKEADFDAVIDTNLKGAFHMIKHCCRTLMKRGGRIINISSVVGLMGNAGQVNYSASKAGVIGMTKSVARELASRGVCCNAIAPGFIATDMTDAIPPEMAEKMAQTIPMGRVGKPEDVAALAAFLASDAAGYITGEVIRVDGGMAM